MEIDQYTGCIIGQAIGDAIGFPVEGMDPKVCENYIEKLRNNKIPKGRHGYKFGQYTDDTQLARELIISIVENNSFDPTHYALKISKLFENNTIVGRGIATNNAAHRLISGIPWQEAGEPTPSAGNGTAMRAAPIGLYCYNNLAKLKKLAIEQSIITHKDERCGVGSIVVAGSVAYLLENEPDGLLDHLVKSTDNTSALFSKSIEQLKEWIDLDYKSAVEKISKSGEPDFNDGWHFISPYVIPSVLWSLYSFLKSSDHFMGAIKLAIRVGGDVDTTAAMTGALSGAYLGEKKLPQKFVKLIHDNNSWKAAELSDIAKQLFHISIK